MLGAVIPARGGPAGALTGLLFVALSIKGEALAASVSLRSRAAQTLVLFLTSAITCSPVSPASPCCCGRAAGSTG
jgi:hypothetical protein